MLGRSTNTAQNTARLSLWDFVSFCTALMIMCEKKHLDERFHLVNTAVICIILVDFIRRRWQGPSPLRVGALLTINLSVVFPVLYCVLFDSIKIKGDAIWWFATFSLNGAVTVEHFETKRQNMLQRPGNVLIFIWVARLVTSCMTVVTHLDSSSRPGLTIRPRRQVISTKGEHYFNLSVTPSSGSC